MYEYFVDLQPPRIINGPNILNIQYVRCGKRRPSFWVVPTSLEDVGRGEDELAGDERAGVVGGVRRLVRAGAGRLPWHLHCYSQGYVPRELVWISTDNSTLAVLLIFMFTISKVYEHKYYGDDTFDE